METLVAAIPPTATAAIGIITLPVLDISTPLAMALTEIAAVPLLPLRRPHLPPPIEKRRVIFFGNYYTLTLSSADLTQLTLPLTFVT